MNKRILTGIKVATALVVGSSMMFSYGTTAFAKQNVPSLQSTDTEQSAADLAIDNVITKLQARKLAQSSITQYAQARATECVRDAALVTTKAYKGKKVTKASTSLKEVTASNVKVETVSVSCLKVTWDEYSPDRTYSITCTPCEADYSKPYFVFKPDACYITGLCEGKSYTIELTPEVNKKKERAKTVTKVGSTESVEIIQDFDYVDGFTMAYAYEHAGGLTANPSWGAIQGCFQDPITDTGIMRDEYGDYCVAMGTYYGYCGDRFLITLENETQFTVKICDSKGDRQYHDWGGSGKCVIEFIHADEALPSCAAFSGSYGGYNWNGLDLGAGIKSIQKINY